MRKKATKGSWISTCDAKLDFIVSSVFADKFEVVIAKTGGNTESDDNSAYIAAANPKFILALIAENERLAKENEELRANNYGPEILNDPQALTAAYFAGRMAEGRENNREMDSWKKRLTGWRKTVRARINALISPFTGICKEITNQNGVIAWITVKSLIAMNTHRIAGARRRVKPSGKNMKLTVAQIRALKAIKQGQVILSVPHRATDPIKIYGANKGVVNRLMDMKLIAIGNNGSFTSKPVILTDEGHKIMRVQCKSLAFM